MIFYTIIFLNYIFIMSNMNLHNDFKKLYDSNISSLFVELYKISEPDLKLITISKWIKKVFSTINLKNFSKDSIYKKTVLEDKLNFNFSFCIVLIQQVPLHFSQILSSGIILPRCLHFVQGC